MANEFDGYERLSDPDDHSEGIEDEHAGSVATAGDEVNRDFPAGALGITGFTGGDAGDPLTHLDPKGVVAPKLLAQAVEFFRTHRAKFANQAVISVLDYSLPSSKGRFHVIDLASGEVWSLHMANGKGSEPDHDGIAHHLGNVPGSNMSSVGFVRTAETYEGKHGLSLRLDGLSPTNSNLRTRAVVVHGASYVTDRDVIQGRSNGCPAVPNDQVGKLIGKIKGGSLMYFGPLP
ncbi:MAG TPA: murein L,D-transpeptidase catalytic domain family protein [Longimicrobiaceae bacterium]|nr:murein L,D-transpeptidase catalytic domain family protein [Longimicrobiaceae bacterium]